MPNIYPLIRPLLFKMDEEKAHYFTLSLINSLNRIKLLPYFVSNMPRKTVKVMGLTFPNPVGLAGGLDRHAECINAFDTLGFGFIEVGTFTPQPQEGNPKPRYFRLPEHQSLINRVGFYNKGIDYGVEQIQKSNFKGILGVSIAKNRDTPIEKAADDYLYCIRKAYPVADYIALNISSPNTPGLRILQQCDYLRPILRILKDEQFDLADRYSRYVPFVLKVAPDLDDAAVKDMAEILMERKIDAIIVSNTSLSREGIDGHAYATEEGGLSGAAIREKSTHLIKMFYHYLQDDIPIIGVGGILSAADALEKFAAGAKLIQLYTGLIYQGPQLIADILKAL